MTFPTTRMRRVRGSEALRRMARETRLSRDDLVLPGTDGFVVPDRDEPLAVTVSIGVASTGDPATEAECLLSRADTALYQAKHEGRDRVIVNRDTAEEELPQAAAGVA